MAQIASPSQHQYRTLDHCYTFKTTPTSELSLKIRNLADQVIFKATFPLSFFQNMAPLTFNKQTIHKILDLLVQKKQIPPEYLPKAPAQADLSLPTASTLPTSDSTSPAMPSSSLDPTLLATLQGLYKKTKTLAKRIQANEFQDQQTLGLLAQNPRALEELIASQTQKKQALRILYQIKQDPKAYQYYQTFYQKLTGICLASYTIHCGMTENAEQNTLGYVSQMLDAAGGALSIAGTPFKIIGGLLKLKNIKDNQRAVKSLIHFFTDLDQSLQDIKTLSCLLALEQKKELQNLPPLDTSKRVFNALKYWFSPDEMTNPIVVKAAEDAERFLIAVCTQKIPPSTTPEQAASYIVERPLTSSLNSPSAASSPSAAVTPVTLSSPAVDAASKEEIRRLQEQHQASILQLREQHQASIAQLQDQLQALKKQQEADRAALLKASKKTHADVDLLGSVGERGEAQAYKQKEGSDPRKTLQLQQELDTQKTRLDQLSTLLQIHQESVSATSARVDRLEEKKGKRK